MAAIRLGPFLGAISALRPKLLGNNSAVISTNHMPERADLRPWRNPLTVGTAPSGNKTIHILKRNLTTDAIYWLTWANIVHAVSSFINSDTTKRTYYTGDGAPKVTDNIIGLAGAPYPTSYRDLGIPAPVSKPVITQTAAGTGTDETRYYAYTYLSDWNEEGPPAISLVVTCKPGATFNITMAAPPTGAGNTRGINRIRIYRTVAGESGAAFFFLREITAATTSTDDARAVGTDTLPTTNYAMPPTDLQCLTGLWNGMMAGITGNAVRYSEQFKPHAWPVAYETLCADTPIALAVFQKNLLILTTGRPRLVYGSAPEAMDDTPVEFIAACVSVRSVVSLGHGAAWATSNGLAYVGSNGPPRLLTAGVMLPEDWKALNPETMIGAQYRGWYFGFYDLGGGTLKGFMIDPLMPEKGMYFFSTGYSAAHYDPLGERLYVVEGTNIRQWDGGTTFMTATHRSKLFRMPAPVNLSVAKVLADTYPCTFTMYADSRAAWTRTVTDNKPFFLPSGYTAEFYQFEISTANDVTGVVVTDNLRELTQ